MATKKKVTVNGGKLRLRNDKNKVVKTSFVDGTTGAAKKNRKAAATKKVKTVKATAIAKASKPKKKKK